MGDLRGGARNAVAVCMGVNPGERVAVVTDRPTLGIAEALVEECEGAGATTLMMIMEDFGPRPLETYPEKMAAQLSDYAPAVSFFAAGAQPGELGFRQPYREHVIYTIKARHGHMVTITEQLMEEGMSADYHEIARITHRVNDAVKGAREIEVKAPSGTDMIARFDPSRFRWQPCPGIYHEQGQWGNLPEGETFTTPASVEGVVGAEVIGDHFSDQYGVLPAPARFEISGGILKKVQAHDPGLQRELEEYLSRHPNSSRVGEYAIGTNVALERLSGNLLQDEKIPGVHIAFGHPYPEETGADWTCPTHVDLVTTRSTIKVDGQYLMKEGNFLL